MAEAQVDVDQPYYLRRDQVSNVRGADMEVVRTERGLRLDPVHDVVRGQRS
jgi:hypothetical protein